MCPTLRRAATAVGLALIGLLCCALPATEPSHAADNETATLRRTVIDLVRRPETRTRGVDAIAACADDHAALTVALEAAAAMQAEISRAIADRDSQGRARFRFYCDKLLSRDESEKDAAAHKAMCTESRTLSDAILAAELVAARLEELARGRCEKLAAASAEIAADVRTALATAKTPAARAAVFRGLASARRADLAPELLRAAVSETSRDERIAALGALRDALPHDVVSVVRGIAATEDPYVRCAAYDLLASERSVDAMDALIGRLPLESSRARENLVTLLTRLSGQTLGDAARAWQDWWASARPTWQAPQSDSPARTPPPGPTLYFGLDVASSRVLFVLDCSSSMLRGVRAPGPGLRGDFGEPKLDLAMRELEQALQTLPEGSSVGAVAFGTNVKSFSKRLVPATPGNRDRILAWMRKIELEHSTNLGGALMEAFEALEWTPGVKDEEIADTVVILSDGDPNSGPLVDSQRIIEELARRNPWRLTRIHTVCLGAESRPDFMARIARAHGGQFVHYMK